MTVNWQTSSVQLYVRQLVPEDLLQFSFLYWLLTLQVKGGSWYGSGVTGDFTGASAAKTKLSSLNHLSSVACT